MEPPHGLLHDTKVLSLNDARSMEIRNKITEKMLHLTLEVVFLLSGQVRHSGNYYMMSLVSVNKGPHRY